MTVVVKGDISGDGKATLADCLAMVNQILGEADFTVPYEILGNPEAEASYLENCKRSMEAYVAAVENGLSNDTAGYMAPQGLRNILIISATPFQWKHMIGQRACRRNTVETRYVMLSLWEKLYELSPALFSPETTGMFCMKDYCAEGAMGCGDPLEKGLTPAEIIGAEFPLCRGGSQ